MKSINLHIQRVGRRALFAGGTVLAVSALSAPVAEADDYIPVSQKGAAEGVAALDASKLVPVDQVPFDAAAGPIAYVGETNSTSYLQAKIAQAGASHDVVRLRPGVYVCEGLSLPGRTTLDGWAGDGARYGGGGSDVFEYGGVQLRRPAGSTSTQPVMSVMGGGAMLRGVTIDGNGSSGTDLYTEAFEANIVSVRVIRVAGTGFEVAKADNGVMRDIWIDNCGTDTLPAVLIHSVTGTGSAGNTNNHDIYNLHIERAAETALQIGNKGANASQVQWLRFYGLHVESPDDGVATPGNTAPLIKVHNVQGIDFIAPMLYGGPGYILEHDQDNLNAPDPGGIRLTGGAVLGQETWGSSQSLFHLLNGDSFTLHGTALTRYTGYAATVEATYGTRVWIDPSRADIDFQVVNDLRANRKPFSVHGDQLVRGHLTTTGSVPGIIASGAHVASRTVTGDDTRGTVEFSTSANPLSGNQVEVSFARSFASPPIVTLTPMGAGAAQSLCHVGVAANKFIIRCANTPAAGTTLKFAYHVIG